MLKDDYGRSPEYLSQVKEEIRREKEMTEAFLRERRGNNYGDEETTEVMSNDERIALLDQLKAKWSVTNQKYQRITHIVKLDTVGQVRRKETLEAEIKQLETDIERLSRPGPVLIRS